MPQRGYRTVWECCWQSDINNINNITGRSGGQIPCSRFDECQLATGYFYENYRLRYSLLSYIIYKVQYFYAPFSGEADEEGKSHIIPIEKDVV